MRDLLTAGSWEVVPGLSRCGSKGGVVPMVGVVIDVAARLLVVLMAIGGTGTLRCTDGGVVPTGGVATVVVRVGVWAVADMGLGVCCDVADVGDVGDVGNACDLIDENC